MSQDKSLHQGFSSKFIRKYMRLAREVATEGNPCYSRQIGAVIINEDHEILGVGYNGPPAGTPHTDDKEYLEKFFWPQLTDAERKKTNTSTAISFADAYNKCGQCPRRLVGAKSGERTSLCSCQHAERNAISRATRSLKGSTIFIWGCSVCIGCAGAIINSRIKRVVYTGEEIYEDGAFWLLNQAGIECVGYDMEQFE